MGNHKKGFKYYVVLSFVVLLNSGIIACSVLWKYYKPVRGHAIPDTGCNRKCIEKFLASDDVNPIDVELCVNEIYSPDGSYLRAHATSYTFRPITKPSFLNITNQTVGQQLDIVYYRHERNKMGKLRFPDAHWKYYETVREHALPDTGCNGKRMVHVEFLAPDAHWKYYETVWEHALPDTGCNGKRMVHVEFLAPDAHWKYYETVREHALPDTGCNGKRMVHVEFLAPDAYWRIYQTVLGPALPERGCYGKWIENFQISFGVDKQPFLDIGYNKKKIVMFQDPDAVKPDILLDMFRIVKETYSPGERDIKIHYTSCCNTAHTRLKGFLVKLSLPAGGYLELFIGYKVRTLGQHLIRKIKGKEPNSIFECISVVILWCAFDVIWITYYMQDRQAVTHKELSLTDIFSKKDLTGTACSVRNETSGGLMAQPMNDILSIQSDDIIL